MIITDKEKAPSRLGVLAEKSRKNLLTEDFPLFMPGLSIKMFQYDRSDSSKIGFVVIDILE